MLNDRFQIAGDQEAVCICTISKSRTDAAIRLPNNLSNIYIFIYIYIYIERERVDDAPEYKRARREDVTFVMFWNYVSSWWRHQLETFSALLALCAGNSPVTGEFPTQRPVTRNFDAFFDLRLNKRLSKQSWDWWFETLSDALWRH